MKKTTKRLNIKKETVDTFTVLSEIEMANANGGAVAPHKTLYCTFMSVCCVVM